MSLAHVLALPLVVVALAGCTAPAATPSESDPVAIATTSVLGSVLGDITQCAGASSTSLMGPGDDPHSFSVSSDQVVALTRAKLVVANGYGLEEGLSAALSNAASDGATIFEVAPLMNPLEFHAAGTEGEAPASGETDEHGHAEDATHDPHAALDAARMALGAQAIGDKLAEVTDDPTFAACGPEVASDLTELDAEVRTTLASIPADRRVLVTDHDAFAYFADAYDFETVGVVVPGGSTDAEPSSADLAAIVEVIKQQQVPAIFSNVSVSPQIVQAVAAEVGADVAVVPLFVDSLGPEGSGAETYADMMRTNARLIADALG